MRSVWKQTVELGAPLRKEFMMPAGAKFLNMEMSEPINRHNLMPRNLYLWFDVDTEAPGTVRQFSIIGTGFEVPENASYVGTVIPINDLVLHIWETYES